MSGMKNGYKISEIGIIPEDWEVVALGSVFKLSSGEMLSQKLINNGKHPVYGGNGINGYHNQYLFEEPKIVIGRVGAKCGCIHYTKPYSWITDNALYISKRLRPFNDQYLLNHLESLNLNFYANQNAQPVISGTKIYPIQIPFPPLPEQQKIADILTSVDDHISETEVLIEKIKVLKQGMMQQLLTKGIGHTEFKDTEIGRIPVEWEVTILGKICEPKQWPTISSGQLLSSGYPVYGANGVIGYFDKYTHKTETILVTCRGATCGTINLCVPYSYVTGNAMALDSIIDTSDLKFVYYFLTNLDFSSVISGSAQPQITGSSIRKVAIPLPPLPEQRQIAAILTSVDDQIDTYQAKLASLTRLKTGLMQKLLTGKIRVKV